MTHTFNQDVLVDGTQDAKQLRVQGHTIQIQPLQTWEDGNGNILTQITNDGRLQLGDDLGMATPDSLLEVHRAEGSSVGRPTRGIHSLGQISGTLNSLVQWMVGELELRGTGVISALHTALRIRATNLNTGAPTASAELRAADIEVLNDEGSGTTALPKATGLQIGVTNAVGKTITEAVGLRVKMTNNGTITNPYSIFTQGPGFAHFDDALELAGLSAAPPAPTNNRVRVYAKTDGKLWVKDWMRPEYELGGGGSSSLDVTVTAGEALTERDLVYLAGDSKWYKVDADASPIKCGSKRGLVVETSGIVGQGTGKVRLEGAVSGFSGLTAWQEVWASTTPGGISQTKPNPGVGSQVAAIPVGVALSADTIFVQQQAVHYLRRGSLATDAALTIQHHADDLGRIRRVEAYLNSAAGGGSTLANYSSSNQDTGVGVQRNVISGYSGDQCSGGTATASSIYGTGYEADKAFDNNNATVWGTAGNVTVATLEYAFATAKTIRRYTIRSVASYGAMAPKDWTLEYYNGSSWQVADIRTNSINWSSSGEVRTFDVSGNFSASSWRLNISSNNGGSNISIAEVEMMEATLATPLDKIAQSFQVSGTQILGRVSLYLRKIGAPGGGLTVRIETDNAGSPSGTLVHATATATVNESTLATTYGWVNFNFSNNFQLAGSTPYWMVLSTDRVASETNYVEWGADGSSPGYTSGEMKSHNGTAWGAENKDGIFEVVSAGGTAFEEACVVGRWSGGTRDMAVRYDDGSGNNAAISTTFKNVSGATMDVTCSVVMN